MIICRHNLWIDSEEECRRLHNRMPDGDPLLKVLVAIAVAAFVALALAGFSSLK